jgi:regulator of PEP synthase PpsR (kinase-PPPase family)
MREALCILCEYPLCICPFDQRIIMAEEEILDDEPLENDHIFLHILADSTGRTASSVVCGAVIQFPEGAVSVRGLSHIKSADEVRAYIERYIGANEMTTVFHTILDPALRHEIRRVLESHGIPSVDLLGPATQIVARMLQEDPDSGTAKGMTLDGALRDVHLLDATYLEH